MDLIKGLPDKFTSKTTTSLKWKADFIDYYNGCGCEFYYLYDHGVWYYSIGKDFAPLHESNKVKELA